MKNRLNVFRFNCHDWKRPRNWIPNCKQFFRNCKYAYQRVTKGYCEYDLWDLDRFYSELFVNSIHDFKQNLHGAPVEFFDGEKDSNQPWIDYLTEMENHFYNSIEDNEVYINEYDCILDEGLFQNIENEDPKKKELKEKWIQREYEIWDLRKKELNAGLTMLKEVFGDLWD